ncbi:MAG: protein-L-isoaspartate(D-aspartate) O-methyltransferase [SAR202 cluster bacterium]|nr:protein-L-isoaspartate(D-aspartate) O-methyltransferase [SAR202 cluster bacterium]
MTTLRFNGHGPLTGKRAMLELIRRQVMDERIVTAMDRVPRDRFLPPVLRHLAYRDGALPIGYEQTISQPLIVALMTSLLDLRAAARVLEVGTGSGYQAAVLAELASRVFTVERVPELARSAEATLNELGYRDRVRVHASGNVLGWPDDAPYDAIVVTCAAPKVPAGLLAQLADDGRLVIPIGSREEQVLIKVVRAQGTLLITRHAGCRFVPLLGPEGWLSD